MSAFDDYLQLLNNNPKMNATKQWVNKLGNNVKTGIEDSLPKGTGPTDMLDFAAGNNPISHVTSMIGSIGKPYIKYSDFSNPEFLKNLVGSKPKAEIAQTVRDILTTDFVNPDIALSKMHLGKMLKMKGSPFNNVINYKVPESDIYDVKFGGPEFEKYFETGALKLNNPLYVSRQSGWSRGMAHDQPDNFIASTQMIDPQLPQTFANSLYERSGKQLSELSLKKHLKFTTDNVKGVPDMIYKIPEGGTVYPAQHPMDQNEILIRQKELKNAESMDRRKFLNHILKYGTAPFALGGLSLMQTLNPPVQNSD